MRVRVFFRHITRSRRLRAFRAVTARSRIVGLFLLAGLAVSAPAATPAQAISMDKSSTIREQCEIEIGPDVIQIVSYAGSLAGSLLFGLSGDRAHCPDH